MEFAFLGKTSRNANHSTRTSEITCADPVAVRFADHVTTALRTGSDAAGKRFHPKNRTIRVRLAPGINGHARSDQSRDSGQSAEARRLERERARFWAEVREGEREAEARSGP